MARKIRWGLAAGLALFVIFNYEVAASAVGKLARILSPVFIGLIVALILNSPTKLLERTLLSSNRLKRVRRALSLIIVLTLIAGTVVLIGYLTLPKLSEGVANIVSKLPQLEDGGWKRIFGDKLPKVIADNLDGVMSSVVKGLESAIPQATEFFKDALRLVTDLLLGIFFGVMIVACKEKTASGLSRILRHFLGEKQQIKVMAAVSSAVDKFSKFLSGQLVEAVVFGAMCYLAFIIFKLPYAELGAIIMGVANLIPMLGGYIGGVIVFVFIYTASPDKAFAFVVIIIVLQQIEQFTTYPLIVGKYVGLTSFWMLFAVVVFGGLFGFVGLILGVPTVAFINHLIRVIYTVYGKNREDKLDLSAT